MNLVFNELSVNGEETHVNMGIQVFEDFLKTYSTATKNEVGFSREIYTSVDFNTLKIADNYYVFMWRNSSKTDRDLVRRFKGMCDRQHKENCDDNEVEMSYMNRSGKGLLMAYQNDMTLISFCSLPDWEEYRLNCEYYTLDTDVTQRVQIDNICSEEQIWNHIKEIELRKKAEVEICKTSVELYEKLDFLFPSLIFHRTATEQIKNQLEQQHVPIVCKKLYELENYFRNWDGKYFETTAFPNRSISPQTKATLERFRNEHTFVFEDEKEVVVSYHMRYTGNIPGRIYFYPDTNTKKAYVCSLTTKLPTVSQPKLKIKC